MKMRGKTAILLVLALLVTASFVAADPAGATSVTEVTSSTYNVSAISPGQANAQAGNVTELSLNGSGVTTSWQGYYGNITGTIILADASGNNFYDWNISTPSGEVYASRSNAVDWSTINCSNSTDVSSEETYLGQNATDPDSVSNTFALTSHPSFYVGSTNITGCYSTHAYDSTGGQGTGFWQVLLHDTANTVYSTILDSSVGTGFDSNPWNFELLVGENGKNGDTTVTPYYFYVELQ